MTIEYTHKYTKHKLYAKAHDYKTPLHYTLNSRLITQYV